MAEDQITVNLDDIARARTETLSDFLGGLDAKRPDAWKTYGYKQHLTFDDFRLAYERNGSSWGAVEKLLGRCWQDVPRFKSPDADEATSWETTLVELLTSVTGWQKLLEFDRRKLVGRFSALIYRVVDCRLLSEPLEQAQKLVDIAPLFEDQIKVTEWHSEERDANNFGKPKLF